MAYGHCGNPHRSKTPDWSPRTNGRPPRLKVAELAQKARKPGAWCLNPTPLVAWLLATVAHGRGVEWNSGETSDGEEHTLRPNQVMYSARCAIPPQDALSPPYLGVFVGPCFAVPDDWRRGGSRQSGAPTGSGSWARGIAQEGDR